MIPTTTIVTKGNTFISLDGATPTNLTDVDLAKITGIDKFLENATPLVVATPSALPAAANQVGILYYVTSTQQYYFSDGTNWRIDFTSDNEVKTIISYAWGRASYGTLGDGTAVSKSSPVTVVGGITNWSQLSAGAAHSLGLTATGIAYAWGRNTDGQLGDGTTVSKSSPVTVVGGITNWSQLSASGSPAVPAQFSLGLTATGIAYAWGINTSGQLGDGTAVAKSSPVTVVGGITWRSVSAGTAHSLGLTTAGIAYSWGSNSNFQLGNNSAGTASRSSPGTVVGGITNWSQLSAGYVHSVGLTSTGIAYAWGINTYGQLGDNTAVNKSSPVTVVGGITTWSQVVAGRENSHGIAAGGIAYSWGRNHYGQLGDNTIVVKFSPVTIVGGITNWSQLSSSFAAPSATVTHSLGLTSTGIAYGWGRNNYGQLGNGTTTNRSSPVTVLGGFTGWSQISTGQHTLAINIEPAYTKGFI